MQSIIIPTYNEKGNLAPLIAQLGSSLAGTEYELIIVDDNSPDGTADEAERLAKRFPSIRVVKRKGKEGLSSAIVAGVSAAKGERIVVMDADLSHPPDKVPSLASALDSCDIAIGSRLIEGGGVRDWPFHRKLISKGADLLARILLGVKASDPLSGFFAMRKDTFARTKIRTKGYKILLNILFDNPKAKVKEVPYTFSDRHAGKTKLGMREMLNYLADLLRIRFGSR